MLAPTVRSLACARDDRKARSALEVQLYLALVDFSRARGVERNIRLRGARLHQLIVDQIFFDFFAADVGQHFTVDLNAGRKGLAAFRFHFPTEGGVLDDIFLGVGQIVFRECGANAGAPATICFQVSGDLRCIHCEKDNTVAGNFSRKHIQAAVFFRIKDQPVDGDCTKSPAGSSDFP